MAWILGIGIFLLLQFTFPRQIVGLILILVVGGAGLYAFSEMTKEQRRRAVKLTAAYSPGACSPDFPILVAIRNDSDRSVGRTWFSLRGYREGYSKPVLSATLLNTDKIIGPGEAWAGCWAIPDDYGRKTHANTSALIWKAEASSVSYVERQ